MTDTYIREAYRIVQLMDEDDFPELELIVNELTASNDRQFVKGLVLDAVALFFSAKERLDA